MIGFYSYCNAHVNLLVSNKRRKALFNQKAHYHTSTATKVNKPDKTPTKHTEILFPFAKT